MPKKMTIITPCFQPENLKCLIHSIDFNYINELIIVYDNDATSLPFLSLLNPKIKEYTCTNEKSILGNAQRNHGIDNITIKDTYVYFLDDDNTIHPKMYELLENIEDNKIYTFGQEDVNNNRSGLLIEGVKVIPGSINTGNYLIDFTLCDSHRWIIDSNCADGKYISEVYASHPDKRVHVDGVYAYYKSLHRTRQQEALLHNRKLSDGDGDGDGTLSPVNKTIWIFWFQGWDENTPLLIQQVANSWSIQNPGWNVNLVSKSNILNYLEDQDSLFFNEDICIQSRSDILRIELLHKYGGVWADATLFCMKPLDTWIHTTIQPTGVFLYRSNDEKYMLPFFIVSTKESYMITEMKKHVNMYWRQHTINYVFKYLCLTNLKFNDCWNYTQYINGDENNECHMLAGIERKEQLPESELFNVIRNHPPHVLKMRKQWIDMPVTEGSILQAVITKATETKAIKTKPKYKLIICLFGCATVESYRLQILKINETWGKDCDNVNVKYIFFLGEELCPEFIDDSRYVYLKGVKNDYMSAGYKQNLGLKYIHTNYDADFVFVCGTDTYINIDKMQDYIKDNDLIPTDKLYIGGKYFWYDYPEIAGSSYVYHDGGPGCLLSNQLIKEISPYLDNMVSEWLHLDSINNLQKNGACDVAFGYYVCKYVTDVVYCVNETAFKKNYYWLENDFTKEENCDFISSHPFTLKDFDVYHNMVSSQNININF